MKTLVADDELTSRTLLQEVLAPYGEVQVCADGAEAVRACQNALIRGSHYDLICLDIMMPNMDGLEALEHIRAAEQRRRWNGVRPARVIITTCKDDAEVVSEAFHEHCDAYFVKPIDPASLLERIKAFGLIPDAAPVS